MVAILSHPQCVVEKCYVTFTDLRRWQAACLQLIGNTSLRLAATIQEWMSGAEKI